AGHQAAAHGAASQQAGATVAQPDQLTKEKPRAIGGTSTHVSFDWITIEPTAPVNGNHTYLWQAADDQVERALALGLEPFAFTGNTPIWMLQGDCATLDPSQPAPLHCISYRNFPDPANPADAEPAFTAFFTALSARYCHRVHFYEFWNEENGCGSPDPDCSGSKFVESYVKWLHLWYQAMKAGCSDNMLALGGLSCDNTD